MGGDGGPQAAATDDELSEWVGALLAKGLPVADTPTAGGLLGLRSVYARAVIPSDPRSRLQALNELLPRLVAALHDAQFREATQALLGLAPGTRGTGLMARRRQAAELLGYSTDHFRSRKEGEIVAALAVAVHDDLLRYRSRVRRAVESEEPTGDTPRLGPESLTHEEELVSRIWQHVYGLRAEMIAVARLGGVDGHEAQVEDHRQAAAREADALRRMIDEYRTTYGERLIRHGDAEFDVAAMERLAGWTP